MKNLFIVTSLIIFLLSCKSDSEIQQAIRAYEQQITEDTEMDLNIKFEYDIMVDTLVCSDSLSFYLQKYCDAFGSAFEYGVPCSEIGFDVLLYKDSLTDFVNESDGNVEELQKLNNSGYLTYQMEAKNNQLISQYKNIREVYSQNKFVFDKIENIQNCGDSVLGYVVESKFQMNNPFLNDAEQIRTQKYIFNKKLNEVTATF